MIRFINITSGTLFILVLNLSCSQNLLESESSLIPVTTSVTGKKISDILSVTGFTALQSDPSFQLKGINKLLFSNGDIFILDNGTDFQNIWLVDEKTGRFKGRIGKQGNGAEDYEGLNDIALDEDKRLVCSVAGKMSLMRYDQAGNMTDAIKTGVFGEEVEARKEGFVVYNEYNATDISGLHHLLFYDRRGNLVGRAFPYPEKQDGNGFAFTGFLSGSNGQIWFNPAFSDTVYEISGQHIIPRYVFNFGSARLPAGLREEKLSGWDAHDYSYLDENFIKTGRFLVFGYFDHRKIKLGVFDESTAKFLGFQDAEKDYLYELVQLGDLYPKGPDSFALVLRPSRILYLMKNNLLDMAAIAENQPELAAALKNIDSKSNPLILYLAFNPEAQIEDQVLR